MAIGDFTNAPIGSGVIIALERNVERLPIKYIANPSIYAIRYLPICASAGLAARGILILRQRVRTAPAPPRP